MEKCLREADLATMKLDIKTVYKELESVRDINKTLTELVTTVAVMASEMKGNNEKLDKMQKDVKYLKDEDGKSLKYYKRQIVAWVILFILGTLAGLIIQGGI